MRSMSRWLRSDAYRTWTRESSWEVAIDLQLHSNTLHSSYTVPTVPGSEFIRMHNNFIARAHVRISLTPLCRCPRCRRWHGDNGARPAARVKKPGSNMAVPRNGETNTPTASHIAKDYGAVASYLQANVPWLLFRTDVHHHALPAVFH